MELHKVNKKLKLILTCNSFAPNCSTYDEYVVNLKSYRYPYKERILMNIMFDVHYPLRHIII